METPVSFVSAGYTLEGLLQKRPGSRGVVLTHPHPLYGGDMRNSVVDAVRRAYTECGFSTLRFNFRGVGKSRGRYDEGSGEQDDVAAAVSFLKDSEIDTVHLCGYSFGAWVNARAVMKGLIIDTMNMIAPPAAFMDFKGITGLETLQRVVVGDRDDIAPVDRIRRMLPSWNPDADLHIIPGADHFFSGRLAALEAAFRKCLAVLSPPGSD